VAVPVAGITDLENHVVDGCIEGHCDCMFMVNTYRWDFAQVAALVAPRPLLLTNTDKDGIFPLEGIERIHQQVRKIYRLYGADKNFGVQISEGPHKDIQELQVAAFRWFNRFLKNEDPLIERAAVPFFKPQELKVFAELPADQINTKIQETFTAQAPAPALPQSPSDWSAMRDARLNDLREKCFRGWPADAGALDMKLTFEAEQQGIHLSAYDFNSQPEVRLRLYVAQRAGLDRPELTVLNVLDDQAWSEWLATMRSGFAAELAEEQAVDADAKSFDELAQMFKSFKWAMAYVAPRGVGPTAWDPAEKKQIQVRRRFMLLGQTLEGMQVWDVRRAAQALRELPAQKDVPLWLQGNRQAAGVALYAALFEPDVKRLDLWQLPASHRQGLALLNVLRYLDLPMAVALAAEHSKVRLYEVQKADWQYPSDVAAKLDWPAKQFQIRELPAKKS
ncbi:MAG TPA: acetylxylan esterase, partial [Pirellulales bacterium]|nr:acetylxylan esterase [Pirellulales bacterium]